MLEESSRTAFGNLNRNALPQPSRGAPTAMPRGLALGSRERRQLQDHPRESVCHPCAEPLARRPQWLRFATFSRRARRVARAPTRRIAAVPGRRCRRESSPRSDRAAARPPRQDRGRPFRAAIRARVSGCRSQGSPQMVRQVLRMATSGDRVGVVPRQTFTVRIAEPCLPGDLDGVATLRHEPSPPPNAVRRPLTVEPRPAPSSLDARRDP